jgi:hypothetical protein
LIPGARNTVASAAELPVVVADEAVAVEDVPVDEMLP